MTITVKINITPLVNWIWIGSFIVCLAAFVIMGRVRIRTVKEMED